MKNKALLVMAAMAGAIPAAGQGIAAPLSVVTVCVEPDPNLLGARQLAAAMFASIGVEIAWREPGSCPDSRTVIRVQAFRRASSEFHPEALAFSQLHDRTIIVFMERVEKLNRDGVRTVTAHVLVHEITHVVEGICRHSDTGIMKARWNSDDYYKMRTHPLPFAQEDISLIYSRLETARVVFAQASAPALAAQ